MHRIYPAPSVCCPSISTPKPSDANLEPFKNQLDRLLSIHANVRRSEHQQHARRAAKYSNAPSADSSFSLVRFGRNVGNQISQYNRSSSSISCASFSRQSSTSLAHQQYGEYVQLAKRLQRFECRRIQTVRSESDAIRFLHEYIQVLEHCFEYENSHPNVEKVACSQGVNNVIEHLSKADWPTAEHNKRKNTNVNQTASKVPELTSYTSFAQSIIDSAIDLLDQTIAEHSIQ